MFISYLTKSKELKRSGSLLEKGSLYVAMVYMSLNSVYTLCSVLTHARSNDRQSQVIGVHDVRHQQEVHVTAVAG